MSLSLTPGVLDGAAQRAFSFGACAGLAIAIHDATGWPLVKVADADCVWDASGASLHGRPAQERACVHEAGMGAGGLHWLALAPGGRLVDVDGAHAPADVLERWDGQAGEDVQGQAALGFAGRDDAVDEYVEAKGEPVALGICASFVAPVLARAGLELAAPAQDWTQSKSAPASPDR